MYHRKPPLSMLDATTTFQITTRPASRVCRAQNAMRGRHLWGKSQSSTLRRAWILYSLLRILPRHTRIHSHLLKRHDIVEGVSQRLFGHQRGPVRCTTTHGDLHETGQNAKIAGQGLLSRWDLLLPFFGISFIWRWVLSTELWRSVPHLDEMISSYSLDREIWSITKVPVHSTRLIDPPLARNVIHDKMPRL